MGRHGRHEKALCKIVRHVILPGNQMAKVVEEYLKPPPSFQTGYGYREGRRLCILRKKYAYHASA